VDLILLDLNMPGMGGLAACRAIRSGWGVSLDQQLDHERDNQRELGRSADYREGVAAFGEKRKADFKGV